MKSLIEFEIVFMQQTCIICILLIYGSQDVSKRLSLFEFNHCFNNCMIRSMKNLSLTSEKLLFFLFQTLNIHSKIEWLNGHPPIAVPLCGFKQENCISKYAKFTVYIFKSTVICQLYFYIHILCKYFYITLLKLRKLILTSWG